MPVSHHFFLLAEDDFEDQEMFSETVADLYPDSKVQIVKNGLEVIHFLQDIPTEELPCLILLDYKMPVLNAVEVLEQLQKDPRYTSITKAVWSSSVQEEHKQLCFSRGASEYFVKPNSMEELKEMVIKLTDLCSANPG